MITEIADKKYMRLDRELERIIVKRVFTIHQLAQFLIIELEKDNLVTVRKEFRGRKTHTLFWPKKFTIYY
jgi:hypothetical protein